MLRSPSFHFALIRRVYLGFAMAWLLAASVTFAQSDAPLHYYDGAIGKSGLVLKAALQNIIKGHTVIPYTATQTDTWDALKVLDQAPDRTDSVVLIYSELEALKSDQYTGTTGTWEREHLWPQSFGIVALNSNSRAKSDLFNLRPIDNNVNSSRGNKFYDYSTAPFFTYPEAPGSTYDSDSWEPRDDEKGSIARSMFYMAVRYDGSDPDVPDLELSDSPNAATYRFGKLTTLLTWSRLFAVNTRERARNTTIYLTYQHNRNPFIDHPEYGEMVFLNVSSYQAWKDLRFSSAELANPAISGDDADPDHDGVPNLLEYYFGRDPRQPDVSAPVSVSVSWQVSTRYLNITYQHNRNATDVTASYESSNDLQTWAVAVPANTTVTATNSDTEQVTVSFASSSPRFLVRLRATPGP